MPRKSKSRKKKGAGMFDFLKAGESKSYTKKRCNEYQNEITKLEKRIDELKAKQEEYKCLGGDTMTDNPMQQPEIESDIEPEHESDIEPEPTTPQQVDVEMDSSDDEEEEDPKMQLLYKNNAPVEDVLNEVEPPEDRKDDSIDKTITKGLIGGRRRRRKSRRKPKRKSRKRRKSRKKRKSRKRRRRKSRR